MNNFHDGALVLLALGFLMGVLVTAFIALLARMNEQPEHEAGRE